MSDITVKVFYRLSNQPAAQPKVKIAAANKIVCLQNCLSTFGFGQVTVFGDRLDARTAAMLDAVGVEKKVVNEGSGGGTFRRAAEVAMQCADDEIIYLLEDDFLHLPPSPKAIVDGLSLGAQYVTLYDHPDKYINFRQGGNPHVTRGGEKTRLLCGRQIHWKVTNSTVMTFATTAGQLRRDWKTFIKFCGGRYTDDYRLFRSLGRRGRQLISAVPGLATHCETAFLSPFTDWAAVAVASASVEWV